VAKVEAVGPAGYIVDTHLLEDRFMFARAMREPAPRESPAEGGKMP
jgi:hypothetical protein